MTPNFGVSIGMVNVKYRTEMCTASKKNGEENFRLNDNCILMVERLLGRCTYHK